MRVITAMIADDDSMARAVPEKSSNANRASFAGVDDKREKDFQAVILI